MKKIIALLCLLALCCSLCACGRGNNAAETVSFYVYVDASLSTAEAQAVGSKLSQLEDVQSVTFIDRQEALEDFKQAHDNPDIFAGIDSDFLRHRFLVTAVTNDMEGLIQTVESIPGVADVQNPLSLFA